MVIPLPTSHPQVKEIPLDAITHVNVVDPARCEFALLAPSSPDSADGAAAAATATATGGANGHGGGGGGLVAFRAAGVAEMSAWIAAIESKEAPALSYSASTSPATTPGSTPLRAVA